MFYLGGQINCSTTIHSRSDILRVLSMSDKAEEDNVHAEQSMTTAPPSSGRKGGFFRSFKMGKNNRQTPTIPEDREAGMENQLINKIQKLNFKNQMKMFYTAYSKVDLLVPILRCLCLSVVSSLMPHSILFYPTKDLRWSFSLQVLLTCSLSTRKPTPASLVTTSSKFSLSTAPCCPKISRIGSRPNFDKVGLSRQTST